MYFPEYTVWSLNAPSYTCNFKCTTAEYFIACWLWEKFLGHRFGGKSQIQTKGVQLKLLGLIVIPKTHENISQSLQKVADIFCDRRRKWLNSGGLIQLN